MASALAAGFVRDHVSAEQIYGFDPSESARRTFVETVGDGCTTTDSPEVLSSSDVVILAVKPQIMPAALEGLRPHMDPSQLVVSIAAGLTVATLEPLLLPNMRLVRVMPNTPCLIGRGVCGVSRGTQATAEDEEFVCALLNSVGLVERVPEKLLDAVTGLSGSGPAYVFQMIEALSDGGVKVGLPRDTATRLAAQTLAGAAEMVLETGQHPGALKDAVTSPGGTTIAAIHEMERGGVRAALINAVEASTKRSRELG